MEDAPLQVSVWRGRKDGHFQLFDVPRRANQTVLDVVTYIQRTLDPTLAYRFACRVGMCGSCAMMVDGRPRWTCRTHISKIAGKTAVGRPIQIAPLANLPVIKDLATDMTIFFEKWQTAHGVFVPTATREDALPVIKPSTRQRRAVDAAIECINCAICYSACDSVTWNPDYLGPAALNRAWTLANDSRDGGGKARLAAISAKGGCHNCHSHQSCEAHCPSALNPTASIAGLKRLTAAAFIRGEPKASRSLPGDKPPPAGRAREGEA